MSLVRSIPELELVAAQLIAGLNPHSKGATMVTLSGDLGAGKTTFAKAAARELGVVEEVTSPTFVIERIYDLTETAGHGYERLVHIDAYRLEDVRELAAIGWGELLAEPKNLILLEWPEKIAEAIPEGAIAVKLTWLSETDRDIEIS